MGKRLILVEDEPTLARALVRLLRRGGFDVTLATSCDEALKALGTFALGIFDIDLPDGDGVELAERLRRDGVVRHLVFFSGTPVAKKRVRALGLGPFVEKSRGYAELQAAIEHVLDCKQAKVAGGEDSDIGDPTTPPPSGVRGSRPDK